MARSRRARPRAPRGGGRNSTPNQQPHSRPRRRPRRTNRSNNSNILAQGVGSATGVPFGSAGKINHLNAWDAFSPAHLPLPRVTGPYAVVRTTRLMNSNAQYLQFGTFQRQNDDTVVPTIDPPEWTNIFAVQSNENEVISTTTAASVRSMPMPGIGGSVTAVPAALSVQVMNPNALQTTSGIVAMGTYKTQVDPGLIGTEDPTKTFGGLADNFVSFQAPRLLSAGKLALKGVQVNSFPLNMSELANFAPIYDQADGGTWYPSVRSVRPVGMAPICIHNPDSINLNYLVTMEWRVRFDPSNPAVAAHRYHGHCSDEQYARFVQHRTALGHGCYDIADASARSGVPRGGGAF